MGAVVIDRHAAADIKNAHGSALLDQIAIHPHRLGGTLADRGDVRNLAALVVVQHFKAGEIAGFLKLVHHVDDLRRVEPKNRFVPRGFLPMTGALGGKADPDPEIRQHGDFPRALQNQVQLARHLQHQHDLHSHLLGVERQIDELLVLVAVANDIRLGVVHMRQRRDQLRLRARLQPVVILFPELRDLLDHLPLLVHLDRINAAILALVLRYPDRLAE